MYSEIDQNDLARIYYIRKLIGSQLIKCQYYSMTLQTVVGFRLYKSLTQSTDIIKSMQMD
jgi:hypothetical protein